MSKPQQAIVRPPPLGSENHLPTWSRESLSREVFRALEATRKARNASWDWWSGVLAVLLLVLLLGAAFAGVIVAHTPTDPLTIAGDQDD
jgi:hypothetical protein